MAKDFYIKESQLDDFQHELLMRNLNESLVVSGSAGSGKSVIALHKAKRILDEKYGSCQVIVYTKALNNYMNNGKTELGLDCSFTYHWRWVNKLNCPETDYIIVDEIQDFTEEEIGQFIKAAKKQVFFFGDTAQSIYDGLKTTMTIKEISRKYDFDISKLVFNYRLPISVAKITEQYIGDGTSFNEGSYKNKSNETETPWILHYNSKNEQIHAIARIVKTRSLLDVSVLLPSNSDVKMFYDKLTEQGMNCECKYNSEGVNKETLNFNTSNIKLMTYHSAKGLQFETVFIPCCEFSDEKKRKPLYVAMTRASENLYIMYSGILSNFFNEVPISLYTTKEYDDTIIEDI